MDEQVTIRQEKFEKLKQLGIEIYPYSFPRNSTVAGLKKRFESVPAPDLEKMEEKFSICGRIMAVREMGKSSFMHLFDGENKFQVYIRKELVTEKEYQVFKLLDIGDIIGVSGKIFRTRTNELTLLISQLTFLSKSFHPMPEKWHGLQDKELRFRQRYLDLIVNEKSRLVFRQRSLIIQKIRQFFLDRNYIEVETPMMQPIPGGAAARPFVTHHNALNIDLYMRIAPELYLKRLLVGGVEKVYEINRNFRNEGISQMHNPEFTMLEFYELYQDFNFYMTLTEELFSILMAEVLPDRIIHWNDRQISVTAPFARKKYMDLIAENAQIPLEELWDENKLKTWMLKKFPGEELPPTYGKMLEYMFDYYVEESLQDPVFVTYFPKAISPLTKVSRQDSRETERFELYVAGMEIANGFSELNDPFDQRQRFEAQLSDRQKGDDEAQLLDNDFLEALEYGMAPAAGEGIGIDRLVMLLTATPSIKEVILFPLLRPNNPE